MEFAKGPPESLGSATSPNRRGWRPDANQRIAYVGNSFIYFNDLPNMIEGMLGGEGRSHEAVTPGGAKLSGHAGDPRVSALLAKEWDVVVLQDNSQIPGGYDLAKLGAGQHKGCRTVSPVEGGSLWSSPQEALQRCPHTTLERVRI